MYLSEQSEKDLLYICKRLEKQYKKQEKDLNGGTDDAGFMRGKACALREVREFITNKDDNGKHLLPDFWGIGLMAKEIPDEVNDGSKNDL